MSDNYPDYNNGYSQPPDDQPEPPYQSELPPPRIEPQRVAVRLPNGTPYVTYTILVVTILVYVLQEGTRMMLGFDLPAALGLKVNELIVQGQVWRLVTPILLHGNLLHIAFNMYALYILGPNLERHFGSWKFLALYVAGGFAGNVISFVLTPSPSLGASTAVFALLAAQGVFAYQNQAIFGPRARAAYRNVLQLAAINFLIGLYPGIDNWGHFGGAMGGLLVTWFGGPSYRLAGQAPHLFIQDGRSDFDFVRSLIAEVFLFAVLAIGWIVVQSA